jgi:asparagine synthase (glutamine-hydrolysing)
VSQLVTKASSGNRLSETDEMALAGILSTQLVYTRFIDDFSLPPPLSDQDDVKVYDQRTVHTN